MISHRPARLAALVSACLAMLVLGACGGGEARKRDANGNLVPTARELDPAGTLYAETVAQAESGNCEADTINVLTCFSYRGHGYEGAQTALGQCLLRTGRTQDGLTWLRRAAEAGGADAQKRLAQVYANGKLVAQDNVEAATWNKLYLRNPALLSLGVQPDRSVAETLSGRLTAQENAAADHRANAFTPKYWQPTDALNAETAATCRVRVKRMRPNVDPYLPKSPDGVGAGGY
ncbi:MAG: hypothetical protein WBG82_14155 [Parvibaculum sp.]|uniref:hypothetical protein n=1 Tax=Parvibaculum sp. TaxID=2024848 RepID=UPI003C750FA6